MRRILSALAATVACALLPAVASATPGANFSITPSAPTVGHQVTFKFTGNCDQGPCNESWTDNGAVVGTGLTVRRTYTVSGSHTVKVTITNGRRQSASRSRTFAVTGGNPPPPPVDTDGDGVPDSSDQCPTQAGPASNNGCPVVAPPADRDGDGVPDAQDNCPDVAGPASNQGCPTPPPPVAQCADGVDNDQDGKVDLADPGCASASDDSESPDPGPPPTGVTITDTVDGFPVSHTFAETPGRTNTAPMTSLSSGAPCGQIDSGTYTLTDRDITCRIWLPRSSTATVNISQSVMHACAQNQIIAQGGTINLDHVDVDQRACNDEPAVVIEGTGSMKHSTVVHSSNPLRLGGHDIVVDGNWFHDFESADSTAHTDGLEIYGGQDMLVENNFWTDVTGAAGANSVIFVQVNGAGGSGGSCCTNITLKGNTLGTGGSRPLFLSAGGGSNAVGPVNVIDNRFTSTNVYPQGGWDATTSEGGTTPGFGTFTGNTILVQRTGQLCRVEASNSWSINETGPDACASGPA